MPEAPTSRWCSTAPMRCSATSWLGLPPGSPSSPARGGSARSANSPLLHEVFDFAALPYEAMNEQTRAARERLLAEPSVALHIRRGDYVRDDRPGWHAETDHYRQAVEFVARSEKFKALRPLNLVVFSDDPAFVRERHVELGLDFADGFVMVVDWNTHFQSVYDSYLMSLCRVIIGAVGGFAATTALLARTPTYFVRAAPEGPRLVWQPAAVPSPRTPYDRGEKLEPAPPRRLALPPAGRRRYGGGDPRGRKPQVREVERSVPSAGDCDVARGHIGEVDPALLPGSSGSRPFAYIGRTCAPVARPAARRARRRCASPGPGSRFDGSSPRCAAPVAGAQVDLDPLAPRRSRCGRSSCRAAGPRPLRLDAPKAELSR